VVAAEDAVFGSPVITRLGVADAEVPGFSWVVGARRAKQALWLNEEIAAPEALALGLVNWVVPPAELDSRVDAVARRLVAVPASTLALSKASFAFMEDRQGRREAATYHYAVHQLSHHTSEAVRLLDERIAEVRRRLGPPPSLRPGPPVDRPPPTGP
jgi:enoyl-CoA hydratase